MSTQSKKCRVEFYSNNERFTSLLGITPDHFSTVHLTDNVIVAVGIGDTESLHFNRAELAGFTLYENPVPSMSLENVARLLDFEL